jgi:hypothetical protein
VWKVPKCREKVSPRYSHVESENQNPVGAQERHRAQIPPLTIHHTCADQFKRKVQEKPSTSQAPRNKCIWKEAERKKPPPGVINAITAKYTLSL